MDEQGYPELAQSAGYEEIKWHANVRVLAEMFRMDGEAFGLPADDPMDRWERAEKAYARITKAPPRLIRMRTDDPER